MGYLLILFHPPRFSDKLTIVVSHGVSFTVSLSAEGKGTTVVSHPPLQPRVDLGAHFSRAPCLRKCTLTNRWVEPAVCPIMQSSSIYMYQDFIQDFSVKVGGENPRCVWGMLPQGILKSLMLLLVASGAPKMQKISYEQTTYQTYGRTAVIAQINNYCSRLPSSRGRRVQALSWTTEGFSALKLKKAEIERNCMDTKDMGTKVEPIIIFD